jgi:hypothetical protein
VKTFQQGILFSALSLLCSVFAITSAHASIALDNTASAASTDEVASLSKSFTVGDGSSRGLYVLVGTNTGVAPSHVYWNSTEELQPIAGSLVDNLAGYNLYGRTQWYHLENPTSGSSTVEVVMPQSSYIRMYIHSYTGVDQSDQPDAVAITTVTTRSTTANSSITTQTDQAWVLAYTFTEYGDQVVSSCNLTLRTTDVNWDYYTWDSNGPISPAGSLSTTFTISSAEKWIVNSIAIKPAAVLYPMSATPSANTKETGSIAASLKAASGQTVAFDRASYGSCSSDCGNNTNWNHTVSGPNRGLLVFLEGYNGCTYNVLYNNTAMSEVTETRDYGTYMRTYLFKMENPPTSATGVSVYTTPGSCGWAAGAVSYQGVNQTNMIEAMADNTSIAGVSASVTTTPSETARC